MDKPEIEQQPHKSPLLWSLAIQAGVFLGRVLPRQIGGELADVIGRLLSRQEDHAMVKAARANQWVIHDKAISPEGLDHQVESIFQSAARCIFDYFYFLSRPEKLKTIVSFSPAAQRAFDRIRQN